MEKIKLRHPLVMQDVFVMVGDAVVPVAVCLELIWNQEKGSIFVFCFVFQGGGWAARIKHPCDVRTRDLSPN